MALPKWTGIQGELRLRWPGFQDYFGHSEADMIYYWVGSQLSIVWVGSRLIVWSEVGSSSLMGRESTHCLAQSGPISCRVGSQLIVESEVGSLFGLRPIFWRVGSQLYSWLEYLLPYCGYSKEKRNRTLATLLTIMGLAKGVCIYEPTEDWCFGKRSSKLIAFATFLGFWGFLDFLTILRLLTIFWPICHHTSITLIILDNNLGRAS